jgi:hypothetical protein
LNDEELPPFAELESHLLNIDKSSGLAQQAFSTMSQPENATPSETTLFSAFEQHVDTILQPNNSRPTTSLPLETVSCHLAQRNFQNLMTGSLHQAWNNHTFLPAVNKNTWHICIFISQKHA